MESTAAERFPSRTCCPYSSRHRILRAENLEAGANIDDILAWYDGLDRDQVKAVIEFAARSLDTPVAGG